MIKILLFRSCSEEQLSLILKKLEQKYEKKSIDLVLQKSCFNIRNIYKFNNIFLINDSKFNFFKQGFQLLLKIKFRKYDFIIIPYNKYSRVSYLNFHLISLFIRTFKIKIFTFDLKEQDYSKLKLFLKDIKEFFLFIGVVLSYFIFSFIKNILSLFINAPIPPLNTPLTRGARGVRNIMYVTAEGIHRPSPRIRCYNFANALKEKNLKTQVISCVDDFGAERENGLFKIWVLNIKIFSRLFKIRPYYVIVQKSNYHFFPCVLYKILFKAKLIFDTDDWDFDWPVISVFEQKSILKKLNKHIDIIFCASNYLYQEFKKYNKPIYLIPTVVNSDMFISFSYKNKNKIIISWIGGVTSFPMVFNLKNMISIFIKLKRKYNNNKKICLEILSYKGYLADYLEAYIKELRDEDIYFKQGISADKIPDYLKNVDIGIIPLLHDTSFNKSKSPTKLFEYMSFGIPVVASKIGEAEHIIKDKEDGFLAEDLLDFENKLDILINDENLRNNMGKNARKKIEEKYCLKVAVEKMYSILR